MSGTQQEEDKETGMRDKPQHEMTLKEIQGYMKPLGIPGAPYPSVEPRENAQGGLDWEVGMIHAAKDALWIPSEQPAERVYGKLSRECVTPQLMPAFRKFLARLAPDSTNRLIAVFGDRASGKSHMIKGVGSIVHPEGCIVVDCGGLNMRELIWRTVIDYGKGVKEQFEDKVAKGEVMQSSLELLEAEFPRSVVRKGEKTSINWDAVGARRTKADAETREMKADEDRGAAVIRASNLLRFIYEKEGISVQTNAFGVKTVPGELWESHQTGRPLFLDEFNKSLKGSLDAYQNLLEWLNGNDKSPSIRILNPTQTTDMDTPKVIEFDRRKTKLGWFVGIAGNDQKDGITTQPMSESMEDRLGIIRVGNPSEQDWAHRYSQILTGFPAKTWYDFFEADAKANPEAFARQLVARRLQGLTAAERKLVPPQEIEALKRFPETIEAIRQMSKAWYEQQQLALPESPKANDPAFRNCQNELAVARQHIKVSFRTAIQEYNEALKCPPQIHKKGTVTPAADISEAFGGVWAYNPADEQPGWRKLGANLVRIRQEAIANATIDMPHTAAALVTLWKSNGVFPAELKEGMKSSKSKPVVDLLKYDDLDVAGLGDTQELEKRRDVLMAALRSMTPGLQAAPEQVIPLKNLALAEKARAEAEGVSEFSILLPNQDLNKVTETPVIGGEALPLYELPNPLTSGEYKLADFRAALAAMALPGHSDTTRKRIWPVRFVEMMDEESKPESEEEAVSIFGPLRGMASHGFNLCILGAAGKTEQDMRFLFVLEDRMREEMIVVGPEPVGAEMQAALRANGVHYVVKSDEKTPASINEFMRSGQEIRYEKRKISSREEVKKMRADLLVAFSAICRSAPDGMEEDDNIPEGMKLGDLICEAQGTPNAFTSIVTRVKKQEGPAQ